MKKRRGVKPVIEEYLEEGTKNSMVYVDIAEVLQYEKDFLNFGNKY